ncbi:multi-sensor signal transduction histidine kinase [Candidatus Koribacter versatilis Ellin345]|uniref:histidine kinase n=1 Tax=Koribacter versatilis (strain Ellin345) TaxID=204669 RepID=Q1IL92_KORVE|nr:ATP-binding protein [Candidatus Koribacter versatilis]ABF42358.1 multi-sensor signal transduction histidine kinase [Candidatus Koribacter versatilis Ellin345]
MQSEMAVDLHMDSPEITVLPTSSGKGRNRPMLKENQVRFVAAVVALLTATAIVFSFINFQKEREFETPTDGVWWVESGGHLKAEKVEADGPGEKAGIKQGDVLIAINGVDITRKAVQVRQIYRTGSWSKATFSLTRSNVPIEVPVILTPADRSLNGGLRLIALIYLGIGIYVLFRRWTAPKATHFYLFCLASFVYYSFHFTGKLNQFDWIIYWSNVTAWLLQPALFLHFALTFPETKDVVKRHKWLVPAVYAVPAALLSLHIVALNFLRPSEVLRWNLDRGQMLYLAVYFVAATVVLWQTYANAASPILRQQMKWVTRGTFMAIAPFTIFYVIPYLRGSLPTAAMKISVLSLIFLPLTFGYAIFRYRLMDVDLIFKRGMAYTLAAGTITGIYFMAIGGASEMFHKNFPSAGPAGLMAAIVVTALLFDPFKNWIQDKLDKFFYRKRYDYRKTLIEFGRDLNSETDLDKMLASIVDRLSRTLLVDRIAVFVHDEQSRWVLAKSCGISQTTGLDMSFMNEERPDMAAAGHLFFDNTSQAVRENPGARETIRRLDLNYYLPCTVMGRTIAMVGLGKTTEGDFLSSEDVELLETLAGYIGIALQNARLYQSLAEKITEYERLKEFNENIVESVSVGVLAVDLEDKIESWNAQMEVMYALPRAEALGKRLSDVFPLNFVEEFYRVRQVPGINNLYKFRMGTPAGDTRICNIAIAPLVTRDFNVIGRIIILDDMTDRVELESQLAQAEKLSSIGLLAAGVAHEVNTPLAVISSYAQMLSKQLQGDERRSALLEKITTQTFRASEIVNNLLNFSRTGSSEFAEVDINKVVSDTLALLEHQLKTSRVKVENHLAPTLPKIYGNTGKLQQVFLNLFLNAKDAMPSGGTLSITTRNGRAVEVEVCDTGSGIAPEHIQRIYDPFFTTKKSPRQGHSGGTGLGLAVTYGIIQEHAGKIRVDSRPGEGTQFTMEFPMVRKAVNA